MYVFISITYYLSIIPIPVVNNLIKTKRVQGIADRLSQRKNTCACYHGDQSYGVGILSCKFIPEEPLLFIGQNVFYIHHNYHISSNVIKIYPIAPVWCVNKTIEIQ